MKKYTEVYTPLVKNFCDKVQNIANQYRPEPIIDENGEEKPGHNRAPAPFLPIIGTNYHKATVRVAIYGMETYCWHDLYRFIKKFDKDNKQSLADVKAYTDGDDEKYTNRFLNHHGLDYETDSAFSFWKFVYSTLASIYAIDEKEMRKSSELLSSFVWGNVNAYEKYEATWKNLKVDSKITNKKEDWKTVYKTASKYFNSAQLLLPYTRPHIMVVFYWGMSRKWLTGKNGKKWEPNEKKKIDWGAFFDQYDLNSEQKDVLKKYIRCFYLAETDTYVFKTMHPQGMLRRGKGLSPEVWKAAINYAIKYIMAEK